MSSSGLRQIYREHDVVRIVGFASINTIYTYCVVVKREATEQLLDSGRLWLVMNICTIREAATTLATFENPGNMLFEKPHVIPQRTHFPFYILRVVLDARLQQWGNGPYSLGAMMEL